MTAPGTVRVWVVVSVMLVRLPRWPGLIARGPVWPTSLLAPQGGDAETELVQQPAQQRQADPDHRSMVAVDALHEPAAQAIDGERAGDVEWLAGGDIGRDLVIAHGGEGHRGAAHPRRRGAGVESDQ